MPAKETTATPDTGGRLLTRRTHAAGGFGNYAIKRDWRRDAGDEIRAEGYVPFQPNTSEAVGDQPFPTNQDYRIIGFQNGGFENDDDGSGVPDGWTVSVTGSVFSVDTTAFQSGARSVKFTSSNAANSGYIETDALPIGNDRKWRVSFWAKVGTAGHAIKAEVFWFDATLSPLANPSTEILSTGGLTAWTKYINSVVPPASARYGKLRLTGKVSGSSDLSTAWFDTVDIVENDRTPLGINFISQCRTPAGKLLTFAGSKTTLYLFQYDGGEPYYGDSGTGLYFEDDYVASGYTLDDDSGLCVEDDYIAGATGFWKIIGSGFSSDGNRWEAESVGLGYMVFNNGVDLPVYYHYPDAEVTPLYELRESGVARVGSISEFRGALMCLDVSTIRSDRFADIFNHSSPTTSITAKQYGSRKSNPHRATSVHGYALQFDGVNDYLQAPDAANLDLVSSAISIEGYIKIDSTSTGDLIYIAYREVNGGGLPLWSLAVEAPIFGPSSPYKFTKLSSILTTSTGLKSVSVDFDFAVGVWYHVAMTFDGSLVKFHVDGSKIGESAATGTIAASNQPVRIGNTDSSSGTSYKISEVRVWTTARTLAEISAYKNSSVAGDSDLLGCWMMDEGSGVSTADSGTHGNNAAFVDAPAWIASDSPCDSHIEMQDVPASAGGLTNDGAGLATFASATAHGLSTGDYVTVSGSSTSAYNVTAAVTVLDIFRFTYAISVIGAGTSAGSPVFRMNFFDQGSIGKTLIFSNGMSVEVVNFINATKVKVSGSVSALDGEDRVFRTVSTSTSILTGTVSKTATLATVAGVGTAFTTELSVGQLIRIGSTEEVRQIVSITSNTALTVDTAFTVSEAGVTGYRVSDYTVLLSAAHFTSSMVGKKILFDDGSSRTIIAYQNSKRVDVDDHREIDSQLFLIENISAYSAITDGTRAQRVRYRVLWSGLDEPYTFNSSPLGSILNGSNILELQYQAKSFKNGDQITIPGAGINGANLTAIIQNILPNHTTFVLDTFASTDSSDVPVIRTASIGSIVGYKDLLDNSSAAVVARKLSGIQIIYKENGLYLCDYTGDPTQPFAFRFRSVEKRTPFFKYSLSTIAINGIDMHVYRGRNSFYALDLTRQIPVEIPELEEVSDLFTSSGITDLNSVFGFDNPITKEWFFCYGGTGSDKAICYDYLQRTVRTTSASIAAGCCIERLGSDDNAFAHHWIAMAIDKTIVIYGKTDQPDPVLGNRSAVYSRNGADYQSVLRSSMWGSRVGAELYVTQFIYEVSSHNMDVGPLTFSMYGIDNPAEGAVLLFSEVIELPQSEPNIGLHYERSMFQDELVASGDGEVRVSSRTVYANSLVTKGHSKRERE